MEINRFDAFWLGRCGSSSAFLLVLARCGLVWIAEDGVLVVSGHRGVRRVAGFGTLKEIVEQDRGHALMSVRSEDTESC